MSKLLNFTATGSVGPPQGFRCGGFTITAAGAPAAATIVEVVANVTTTRAQLAALASTMQSQLSADPNQGFVFDGQCILSAISGAGASVSIEAM